MFTRKLCNLKNNGIWLRSAAHKKYSKDSQEYSKVVSRAEKIVGGPLSFGTHWLKNELDDTAILLKKLVKTNPLLKYVKNQLTSSESKLRHGLVVLLVSKAAGFDEKDFTNQHDSGILHSQRALAEMLDMQCTGLRIHQTIMNSHKKEKSGDKQQQHEENKVVLLSGDILLAKALQNYANICNNEVLELISCGLRDQIEAEFLGERGADNQPIPSKPKVGQEVRRYDWENEYNLEKLGSEPYLGQGKEEWVLRTMLQAGSILGKGCQGALKLARRGEDMERSAYILGGHLALIWQLYLDIKDYFTGDSYSLVCAPVVMALWEYPSIYDYVIQKGNLKEVGDAVRSTRCMNSLFSLLDEELAFILKYSDGLSVDDARKALQNIAWTIYREAVKIIEYETNKHNQ
ncbi:all trans-polyprenyl-diphosphate synthase PDSS2-like [Leguminivora glycinivorella]|uniref:all trans-polyprenyl-diphosphate synthase PDSS2-like n=1 Tax=Leguminivora glycinivorella TaxID=1035111 RepID=UPI00200E3FD8|nr:all trans-polyprenyl-diphosphate synthase PDSS2-like [Leguminivora glycinivorella]